MINPAREWRCDYCSSKLIQTGPRAADVLPTPPEGWALVDVLRLVPAHSVKTSTGTEKVGDARDVMRKKVCPACSGVLDGLYKMV